MNKLACAVISVIAPTIGISLVDFLRGLSSNQGFKGSFERALDIMKDLNELNLSKVIFCKFKDCRNSEIDVLYRRINFETALIDGVRLMHILASSACTYLALSSNPIYAIPAVASVLTLFYKPYTDFCANKANDLANNISRF